MRFAVVAICAIAAVKAIMLPEPVNVFAQITPVVAPAEGETAAAPTQTSDTTKRDKKKADGNGSKEGKKLAAKLNA